MVSCLPSDFGGREAIDANGAEQIENARGDQNRVDSRPLDQNGAIRVDPIEEPIEPTILTSALVVASSAGVETIATIDFSPGLTT